LALGAGDDDEKKEGGDDDLKEVKARLGALEEAVGKLTEAGTKKNAGGSHAAKSGGADSNAHEPQPPRAQPPRPPLPAEQQPQPAGPSEEILRATLERTKEISDVGTQTYVMLTTVAGQIAGLRLETEGLRGKISTQDAVRRGEITALQGEITTLRLDMTEVKKDVKEVKADVKEIQLEMQGLRGDVKLEMQGLRAEMNTSIAGLKAASTNQFYTLAVVLAFIAAAIGKLSIGDATALIGK